MQKLKNTFTNLVIVIFSLILIFSLCESILRLKNFIIPHYDIEMWKYAKVLKVKSDNKKIGHVHIKNKSAKLQNVNIKINNLGQRGQDIDINNINTFDKRVLVIGSSITFGWGINEDKALTSIIKNISKKNNKNWLVINGVGNHNAERYINNYIENWSKLNITDLVVQFFVNDTEVLKDNKTNFFTQHTHTGVMVWKFLNSLKSDLKSENIESYYERLYDDNFEGIKTTKKELQKLKLHCKTREINCFIVLTPDIHKLNPYKLLFINKKMQIIANEINFKIYDLLSSFKGLDSKSLWNKYNDPHPNEQGHKIMGEAIYNILIQ